MNLIRRLTRTSWRNTTIYADQAPECSAGKEYDADGRPITPDAFDAMRDQMCLYTRLVHKDATQHLQDGSGKHEFIAREEDRYIQYIPLPIKRPAFLKNDA